MHLEVIDIIVIVAFFILSGAIGIYYSKRASGGMESFFLGGRNMPWYLAGISMVATTFAADTPLAVAEIVGTSGIGQSCGAWNVTRWAERDGPCDGRAGPSVGCGAE